MTTEELFIEGVARGVRQMLEDERFRSIIAYEIAKGREILDPAEAADLLRVTVKTLARNHQEWGLKKSMLLGAKNPRYFRSEIMARASEKMINGRRPDSRTLRKLEVAA